MDIEQIKEIVISRLMFKLKQDNKTHLIAQTPT